MKINASVRERIVKDSFSLFSDLNGDSYFEMVSSGRVAEANTGANRISACAIMVLKSMDLSRRQVYVMLEAVSAHAYAIQQRALGKEEISLKWNPSRSRYDRVRISAPGV